MNENNSHIHYGCGWNTPANDWRNFDASPTLRFERLPLIGRLYTKNTQRFPAHVEYGDIRRGLPLPDNRADALYCSHILEHLGYQDALRALQNSYRILRPGGCFRLVLPDLRHCAQSYLDDPSPDAAHRFMRATSLGQEQRPTGLRGLLIDSLGNSAHRWMWDQASLSQALADSGFVRIRRAEHGDDQDPLFAQVEHPGRWENALGLECFKPDDAD